MAELNIRDRLPSMVIGKALLAGDTGAQWLDTLDQLVDELAQKWHIRPGKILHGGSHALVCEAESENGEAYIHKVEIPDISDEEFQYNINALRIVKGGGYVKLVAYDIEKRAYLFERLGVTLKSLQYPVRRQIGIICSILNSTWQRPADHTGLRLGDESIVWFEQFIPETWQALYRPCPEKVIRQALSYLQARKAQCVPEQYVLLHGDAHNNNTLQVPGMPESFKLIDPEGLFYEKEYDLGVLMREWPEEYEKDPLHRGKERCALLSALTGVEEVGIWEWGFLQTVSTALLLLQIGEEALGRAMLRTAEAWCE